VNIEVRSGRVQPTDVELLAFDEHGVELGHCKLHPDMLCEPTTCPQQVWLYVEPAYRRRGIATALLQRAIEFARERGVALWTAEVDNMPTRRMFERAGFERVAAPRLGTRLVLTPCKTEEAP
jgi:GNAT superfamily N-acetyltransferase